MRCKFVMNSMKATLFPIIILIGGLWTARGEFTIAKSSKPRCVIVQDANATLPEQTAAKELANYLHQITGATFAIQELTDTSNVPENAIIIGPGPVAQSLLPEVA